MDAFINSPITLRWLAACGLLAATAVAAFYWMLIQPGRGGVLARSTSPDGTECLVAQTWNGWDNGGEPYTVSFYSRQAGGPWRWQYLDHEARRWPDCRLDFRASDRSVRVVSGEKLKQVIDLDAAFQPERTPPYLAPGS